MLRFERNDGRWYKVGIETDLLGQVSVVRINGGRIQRKGRVRRDPCADRDEALQMVAGIVKTRLLHDYRLLWFRGLD